MKITPNAQKPYKNSKFKYSLNPNYINFGARERVDKGLSRFYEINQDRMPVTLEKYISNIKEKNSISPMLALKNAFEFLNLTETIKEVKEIFPFEPLFFKLKNPSETKASMGILRLIKEDTELLELVGEGVLKDKSNLTVYLLRKIFLENKTIKEINNDLENDLNEDFKAEYKFKYPNTDYIHRTTLRALGIEGIDQNFRNSLRFTQEEYADIQGEKVSQGLQNFWENLSPEERTAKAKKSVEKFEIWWNSHSKNEILTMIAKQMSEHDMLKDFKHFQKESEQQNNNNKATTEVTNGTKNVKTQPSQHTKVGSDRLKNDELFIKWATNNLKLFIENLSEADKDSLHIKRMQLMASRWAEMTPVERTEYISKIKSGVEPLRFTMIDAWNHSENIIKDLYTHLKTNQIYKLSEFIYSPEEFSKAQSDVMTDFWSKYPEHCKTLGLNIIKSHEKIQASIARGTFDELKAQILRDKKDRIKEFAKIKMIQMPKINSAIHTELEDYAKMFFDRTNEKTFDELIKILSEYDIYTLRKLFSDKSQAKFEEKEKIYNDLKNDLLPKIADKYECIFEYTDDPFEKEKKLGDYVLTRTRSMKFLPKHFIDRFTQIAKLTYRRAGSVLGVENTAKSLSEDLKISHIALEITLAKILYKSTRDNDFIKYPLIDNNAMLNDFMNISSKKLPQKKCYLIHDTTSGDEKIEFTVYSKPNVKDISIIYHSTVNLLKKYFETCLHNKSKDEIEETTNELIKKLNLNYGNDEINNTIYRKLKFIISEIDLVDENLTVPDSV